MMRWVLGILDEQQVMGVDQVHVQLVLMIHVGLHIQPRHTVVLTPVNTSRDTLRTLPSSPVTGFHLCSGLLPLSWGHMRAGCGSQAQCSSIQGTDGSDRRGHTLNIKIQP